MEITDFNNYLPRTDIGDGFSYLYELLSHLTSSKQLFDHKMFILLQLSSETNKATFTRAEVEALFPQYPPKVLSSILNSLFDSSWFIREEGTKSYSLSRAGLLFMRFMPFLYKGDEMDESAFQFALEQIFQVAEAMELDLRSIEFLRDQAIHSLQRSIEEIKSSLISKNSERIYETSKKMSQFLDVIDNFIKRLKELNRKKKELNIPFSNIDKASISILLSTKMKILELLDERKKYLIQATLLGENAFSQHDIERFLYNQDFNVLSKFLECENTGFVPSHSKWIDENDIFAALKAFFSINKRIKERNISPKLNSYTIETYDKGEDPYVIKVEEALVLLLSKSKNIELSDFLFMQKNKVDVFMYLASLCFLDGQYIFSDNLNSSLCFDLEISSENQVYQNEIFKILSKGKITRRDNP